MEILLRLLSGKHFQAFNFQLISSPFFKQILIRTLMKNTYAIWTFQAEMTVLIFILTMRFGSSRIAFQIEECSFLASCSCCPSSQSSHCLSLSLLWLTWPTVSVLSLGAEVNVSRSLCDSDCCERHVAVYDVKPYKQKNIFR